jgi:hypothetical protein
MRCPGGLVLFLFLVGCAPAGPFTKAAGAYAKVGSASSGALATVPSLLTRSCFQAADFEYLQSRLVRLKFETEGVKLPEGDHHVSWEEWLSKAHPTSLHAGSWQAYCGEIEQTGRAFSSAVGALGAYSSALDALCTGSVYEGVDLGKTVDGVNKTVAAVSGSASGPSRAVSAIGKALDRFAGGILRERVERDLEGYVRLADPAVQDLIVALRAYVAAARADVESVLAAQRQVVVSFEKLGGFGEATTIGPCRIAAAAPVEAEKSGDRRGEPARASPETVTLRREIEAQRQAMIEVCRTLDALTKTSGAGRLLAFHGLAQAADEDARQTKLVLAGFEDVLAELGAAHAALVKAGQSKDATDLKTALGTISALVADLGALQAGLARTTK